MNDTKIHQVAIPIEQLPPEVVRSMEQLKPGSPGFRVKKNVMSPEAQRIAIAEACGWTIVSRTPPLGVFSGLRNPPVPLPDYLNDLNAMHAAEKVLTDEQYRIYALRLGPLTTERQRAYISATAAQRAEAFLRTLNIWDDSK